ncbi:ABC-three component system protein [Pseudomonas sp. F01002]|uniref:ABC-three component system protein n=1 Tax=Pseudomonas sp. F01002 TaxID=2555724 RepID=UPI002114F2B4|nr:ABC-three component system protein [Pseudomonas sp. F01002]
MPNFFVEQAGTLNLFQQQRTPNHGFRPGQLGALHAVLAHFSVQDDPAIVCLPTGYGKTSLMMALPMLLGPARVLIVEPSSALRKQVHSHISVMSTLRRIGALAEDCPLPDVHLHIGRPQSLEEWQLLQVYDVVVSTPSSSSPDLAPGAPSDLFDLVIFDEAHHAPADSWMAYVEHFTKARFLFLTATPFRRDGRVIPGKLVYRYPVMRAVDEGAFEPINFCAAPIEDELDDEHVDQAIARAAVQQLNEDRANGFDHRLFVRAGTIKAAQDLVPLYQGLGIAVEAISSKLTKRQQEAIEERLITGALEAIVCVDMFGEGYDFPKLKVAALHAPHQSLVPTIQFIGRFARVDETTGPPTLIAPTFRIKEATASLLKEGVNLAQMIDEAAIAQLAGSLEEQEFMERLPVRKIAESDYESVSPLSFNLYAHVRVFECDEPPNFGLLDSTIGRHLRIVKQWGTQDGTISLVLTADETSPNWAISDALIDVRHDVFLLMFFEAAKLCYIGSTRRTEKLYLSIMDTIAPGGCRPLSYQQTSRARAGLEEVKFYNVGLKNTTFNSQGETYRTLTGPQAERAVTAGDSRVFSQGHFFGSGMNGQVKETIGASSSSRIWEETRFRLYSAQKHTGEAVRRFSNALTVDEAVGAVNFVRSQYDALEKRPSGCAKYADNFFQCDPNIQSRIINQFSFESGVNDPVQDLRNRLSLGLSEPVQELACHYVLGWVQDAVISLISDRKPAIIKASVFREKYAAFVRKHQNDNVLPIFSEKPSESSLKEALGTMPIYVRQLDIVDADADIKIRAVSDFLRASSEKTIWSANSIFLPDSLEELDVDLERQWANQSKMVRLKNASLSEEELGLLFYLESIERKHRMENKDLPAFFVAGSLHCLANQLVIGWHSNYKTKVG